jgi:hypothetical protein
MTVLVHFVGAHIKMMGDQDMQIFHTAVPASVILVM